MTKTKYRSIIYDNLMLKKKKMFKILINFSYEIYTKLLMYVSLHMRIKAKYKNSRNYEYLVICYKRKFFTYVLIFC